MPNYNHGAPGTELSSLGILPTLKNIGYAPWLLVSLKYYFLATVGWLYMPWTLAKLQVIKDFFYFWKADVFMLKKKNNYKFNTQSFQIT